MCIQSLCKVWIIVKENCGSFRLHKPDNLSVSHANWHKPDNLSVSHANRHKPDNLSVSHVNRHKPDNLSVSHANRQRDRRMEKVGPRSVLAVVPQVKMSIVDKIYSWQHISRKSRAYQHLASNNHVLFYRFKHLFKNINIEPPTCK